MCVAAAAAAACCCLRAAPVMCGHAHNNHSVVAVVPQSAAPVAPAWVAFMALHAPAGSRRGGGGGGATAVAAWPRAMRPGDVVRGDFELVEFVRSVGPPTGGAPRGGACVLRHALEAARGAGDAVTGGACAAAAAYANAYRNARVYQPAYASFCAAAAACALLPAVPPLRAPA